MKPSKQKVLSTDGFTGEFQTFQKKICINYL